MRPPRVPGDARRWLRSARDAKIRSVDPDVFITLALPLLTFTVLAGTLMVVSRAAGPEPGPTTAEGRPTLPVELNGPKNEPNPETVQVLLDGVQRMLDDEDRRGESLNSRGAAIAGFLGVVIAVAGTVLRTSGGGFHVAAAVLVALALLALLVAFGVIGWGVLLPGSAKAISIEDVQKFPTWGFVTRDPVMVRGYLLQGAVGTLKRDRDRNNRKARSLRWGYLGMAAGFLFVTAAGIVLMAEAIDHRSSRGKNPCLTTLHSPASRTNSPSPKSATNPASPCSRPIGIRAPSKRRDSSWSRSMNPARPLSRAGNL
jgi:hypothetical protein